MTTETTPDIGTAAASSTANANSAAEATPKPNVEVTFVTNDNKVVTAAANSNLLRISLREKGGIPFKCGGGLCGTCRCKFESGLENTDAIKDKERKHLSEADFARGYRMACQTFVVKGSVSVSWDPNVKR